jgi:hypothetical protein
MDIAMNNESLLSQTLRRQAAALRAQAEALEALALANEGGSDADELKTSDVSRILNCGHTKACEIMREFGTGSGKMRRLSLGRLRQLQREGKI